MLWELIDYCKQGSSVVCCQHKARKPDRDVETVSLLKNGVKDCALLMTAADDFFWTFQRAQSYCQFAVVNYIGFHDRGMLLTGGCGDTNDLPQMGKTGHLERAYAFGQKICLIWQGRPSFGGLTAGFQCYIMIPNI